MTPLIRTRGFMAAVVAATAIGLGGGAANAETYTDIGDPWPGEDSHQQILDNFYGGNFELLDDGVSYSNDTLTAQRVSDEQDQVWDLDLPVDIRTAAIFADYDQSLGYLPGSSGPTGDYVNLFDADGEEYDVVGSAAGVDLTDGAFRWARRGHDGVVSSLETDNLNDADHMVTYRIEGHGQLEPVHLLFFEDTFRDFDFQDLVVEVAAVPSPAAVGPGLALLGMLGLIRRRRERA